MKANYLLGGLLDLWLTSIVRTRSFSQKIENHKTIDNPTIFGKKNMNNIPMKTKKILLSITLLLLAALPHSFARAPKDIAGGKNILKVGCGEYFTSYLTDENKIYATLWNGSTGSNQFTPFALSNIVDVDGAQYTNICRSSTGNVYVIGKALVGGGASITNYPTDAFGRPFTGNSKAYGWYQSFLTIRNDSIYYFGNDQLNIHGGVAITAPIRLNQPAGKKVVKLVVQDISGDITALITAMCSDGRYGSTIGAAPRRCRSACRRLLSTSPLSAGLVMWSKPLPTC